MTTGGIFAMDVCAPQCLIVPSSNHVSGASLQVFVSGAKGMLMMSGAKLYLNDGTGTLGSCWKLVTSA